ncbi:hypothetical protein ACFQVC_17070 [Streptomyces monticola]|uniref:Uncharacterized protein n=1 Tax=Streptomyces monticola TaxID=2666263 RepID=A0ABW2JJV9_9ACTN
MVEAMDDLGCVLRAACCVLRAACCVLRAAWCVVRSVFCVLRQGRAPEETVAHLAL